MARAMLDEINLPNTFRVELVQTIVHFLNKAHLRLNSDKTKMTLAISIHRGNTTKISSLSISITMALPNPLALLESICPRPTFGTKSVRAYTLWESSPVICASISTYHPTSTTTFTLFQTTLKTPPYTYLTYT